MNTIFKIFTQNELNQITSSNPINDSKQAFRTAVQMSKCFKTVWVIECRYFNNTYKYFRYDVVMGAIYLVSENPNDKKQLITNLEKMEIRYEYINAIKVHNKIIERLNLPFPLKNLPEYFYSVTYSQVVRDYLKLYESGPILILKQEMMNIMGTFKMIYDDCNYKIEDIFVHWPITKIVPYCVEKLEKLGFSHYALCSS